MPEELRDNSLILGGLSFFVAFIMLFDLADPMARLVTDTTQTEQNYLEPSTVQERQQRTNDQTDLSATAEITSSNENTSHGGTKTTTATTTSKKSNRKPTDQITTDKNRQDYETQVSHHSSPDMDNLTKNGNYHRSENIDFVQTQQLPRVQQPVFERVLMPEKKRPVIKKLQDPKENSSERRIHTNASSSPVSYSLHGEYDDSEQHYQQALPHDYRTRSHSSIHHHATNQMSSNVVQKHKPYRNFGYDESADEIPPPRYVIRSNGATVQNRYRDYEDGGPPLLVIRDYSKSIPTSTYVDTYSTKPPIISAQNHESRSKKQQSASHFRNGHSNDTEFRTNYKPVRPGFVANAAKMWDRRAACDTGHLNTIV